MKSVLVIVAPIALAAAIAGLIYMYKTGMIEEMLTHTDMPSETQTGGSQKTAEPGLNKKLREVDTSTAEGLLQARDIVRANLDAIRREELERQEAENKETNRKKRLNKSVDDWLKRID